VYSMAVSVPPGLQLLLSQGVQLARSQAAAVGSQQGEAGWDAVIWWLLLQLVDEHTGEL